MRLLEIEGKPVVDAKQSMVLHITEKDVKAGKRKTPGQCAAAQACMRQLKATKAYVHLSRVYIEAGDHWTRFTTSQSLRTEIVSFDRGHKFEQGAFTLAVPYHTIKIGAKRKLPRNKTGTHPQRGNRKKRAVIAGVRYGASPTVY